MARMTRIRSVAAVIAVWVGVDVRADCLDGQIFLESIQGQVFTLARVELKFSCAGDNLPFDTVGTFQANADVGECLLDPQFDSFGAFTTVQTDGFEMTAVCRVTPVLGTFGSSLYLAYGDVGVWLRIEGGDVLLTWSVTQQDVFEGEILTIESGDYQAIFPPSAPFAYGPFHTGCHAEGSFFGGTALSTMTFAAVPAVTTRHRLWENAAGGSYADPGNWSTDCAPAHDPPQRSDIARFELSSGGPIPITGTNATAGRWIVGNGSRVNFSGSAEVFATDLAQPSLEIVSGAALQLSGGGSMQSVNALIHSPSTSPTASRVELVGNSDWTNGGRIQVGRGSLEVRSGSGASTNDLQLGTGAGAGTVRLDDFGALSVADQFDLGVTQPGTLEVLTGSSFTLLDATAPAVTVGSGAAGTIVIRGDDSSFDSFGVLRLAPKVILGGGADASLRVERGGEAQFGSLDVGSVALAGTAEVVVDGQGGHALLQIDGAVSVEGMEIAEVLVKDGGAIVAEALHIGSSASSGGQLADVTIRGRGDTPLLLPSKLIIVDPAGGTLPVDVGFAGPGLLSIQAGAEADLDGGLRVGLSANGTVIVTGLNAPDGTSSALTVTGATQVGVGTDGRLQLDHGARVVCNGPLKIGMVPGASTDALVSVSDVTSFLDVNGMLHVGASGSGIFDLNPGAVVECDTLVVGPDNAEGIGLVTLELVTLLAVGGNAQVGAAPGSVGSVFLSETGAALSIGGTMSIGNPSGGAGGGEVKLVDAEIIGPGTILVNPNGKLIGTGTVAVTKVDNGGTIAPGLSPGTLTIEGDYEQLPGGVLVMEYAGLNPGEFDVLHVTGQTTLGGRLEVHFRGGFSPDDPAAFIQSQDFVEADQGITGDYNQRIYAFPDLFADFDEDGDKDLSDVAAFQNCFGLSGKALLPECRPADWEDDGVIGEREVREISARISGPE